MLLDRVGEMRSNNSSLREVRVIDRRQALLISMLRAKDMPKSSMMGVDSTEMQREGRADPVIHHTS